jgi:hypothetical protein
MPLTETDAYIAKCIACGVNPKRIGAKLGMTAQQVNKRWEEIVRYSTENQSSGYNDLVTSWVNLCQQYQSMGESMKAFGSAIDAPMTTEEIGALVTNNREETIRNLREKAIVLKPYVAPKLPPITEANAN